MKYAIFTLILISSRFSFGQSTDGTAHIPVVDNKVFQVVEQMPEFPGGDEALMKFIQSNIRYPKVEMENDIQGRVVVGFVINEDGSVSDVSIKREVSKGIDAEAIRVVKLLPNFKPGMQKGQPVKVAFILPIMFRLESSGPVRKKSKHKRDTSQ